MLARARVWAVVGDVLNPIKPAYSVVSRLRHFQKTVFLVNSRSDKCLPNLAAAEEQIDAVNLIVSPKVGVGIVDEMISLGITNLFIQPGAGTQEIVDKAEAGGIEVIQGCVIVTPDANFNDGDDKTMSKMR